MSGLPIAESAVNGARHCFPVILCSLLRMRTNVGQKRTYQSSRTHIADAGCLVHCVGQIFACSRRFHACPHFFNRLSGNGVKNVGSHDTGYRAFDKTVQKSLDHYQTQRFLIRFKVLGAGLREISCGYRTYGLRPNRGGTVNCKQQSEKYAFQNSPLFVVKADKLTPRKV